VSKVEFGKLAERFGSRLLLDEPLSKHTTYRIGGPAAAMLRPQSTEEVADALSICNGGGIPWLVLGLGSNVLVLDQGFDGLVFRMGKGFDRVLEQRPDDAVWRVEAGLPTPLLARRTADAGLSGVHRMVGIPGTVGGGVATNSGAHQQEYSRVVSGLVGVAPDATVVNVSGNAVSWEYRKGVEGLIVTEVTLQLHEGDDSLLKEELRIASASRKEGTPYDLPSCGSVFKNPGPPQPIPDSGSEGDGIPTAGQLIDAAGCKGLSVGNAEVSKTHANYIVNLGGATAAEVLALIDSVRGRVLGEFGVELELEVRIVN